MQNEFEKQVQQKMEELKLTPSAPVWVNVEKQIRKKREKRRLIFFLLPTSLLIGAGIWWILPENNLQKDRSVSHHTITPNKKQNNSSKIQSETHKPQAVNKKQTEIKTEETSATSPSNTIKENTITAPEKKPSTPSPTINLANRKSSPMQVTAKSSASETKVRPNEKSANSAKDKAIEEHRESWVVLQETKTNTNDSPVNKEDKTPATGSLTTLDSAKNENKIAHTSAKKDSAKQESPKPVIKMADSAAKKKVAKVSNKWERIYTFQAGISSYKEGFFASQQSSVASPVQNGGLGSGTGLRFPMYDSAGKNNGFSFAIGSGVKRKLGEKFEVSASLQYHFFSVKGWIGDRRAQDTAVLYQGNSVAVSDFYTNGNSDTYTTKYGVLELPVSIGYQPFKKIPLQVSIGTSYGRLIHSNELTFDNLRNIYYKNKDNRVKNFFNLFSSLQYRVLAKNKRKITTGPLIQYSISRTQKQNQYSPPQLFFAGIKTDINF